MNWSKNVRQSLTLIWASPVISHFISGKITLPLCKDKIFQYGIFEKGESDGWFKDVIWTQEIHLTTALDYNTFSLHSCHVSCFNFFEISRRSPPTNTNTSFVSGWLYPWKTTWRTNHKQWWRLSQKSNHKGLMIFGSSWNLYFLWK